MMVRKRSEVQHQHLVDKQTYKVKRTGNAQQGAVSELGLDGTLNPVVSLQIDRRANRWSSLCGKILSNTDEATKNSRSFIEYDNFTILHQRTSQAEQ